MLSPAEMVRFGSEIVTMAREKGARAGVYGGCAIYARCPSISTHSSLERKYADLDLISSIDGREIIAKLLAEQGLIQSRSSPSAMVFSNHRLTVDVRNTLFKEYFIFDLSSRLGNESTTLPLGDLLLLKLQRVAFADKDIKDAIALLLDHRVVSGPGDDSIDRDYISSLANKNWGLWTTIFDNTVTLEQVLDKYIEPEEAQLVWRRIELIQEVLDGKGKSLNWWARALIGKRRTWYRDPAK